MNLKSIQFVRYLAYKYREFRDSRSFTRGGKNNVIKRGFSVSSRIQIMGNGNTLVIDKGTALKSVLIKITGNNNKVIISNDCLLSGCELIVENNNCCLEVGASTFIGHHTQLACTEDNSCLKVGSDCMLSAYIHVRTGDSHSILDTTTMKRINIAESVCIGDHCWIGEGAHILKGVVLQDNIVVSTGAIVTKSFESNKLIGGVPAKLIKENITWDKDRL